MSGGCFIITQVFLWVFEVSRMLFHKLDIMPWFFQKKKNKSPLESRVGFHLNWIAGKVPQTRPLRLAGETWAPGFRLAEVLMRIGFMDRSLHLLSCGRWKPKNSSKFLRQAGYCMGYPRFGAVAALCLARRCSGIARPTLQSPLVKLALINLGAEVVEDLVSYVLWRLKLGEVSAFWCLEEVIIGMEVWRSQKGIVLCIKVKDIKV